MSTRSSIAIKRKSGKIESIYCHWDGYLNYNGKILLEDYIDINKINQLINLGDIASLNKCVEPTMEHSFDKPQTNVVIAYGRDRGETNVDKRIHNNIDEFNTYLEDTWCEYVYLYDEEKEKWLYSTLYGNIDYMELTKDEIERERN